MAATVPVVAISPSTEEEYAKGPTPSARAVDTRTEHTTHAVSKG